MIQGFTADGALFGSSPSIARPAGMNSESMQKSLLDFMSPADRKKSLPAIKDIERDGKQAADAKLEKELDKGDANVRSSANLRTQVKKMLSDVSKKSSDSRRLSMEGSFVLDPCSTSMGHVSALQSLGDELEAQFKSVSEALATADDAKMEELKQMMQTKLNDAESESQMVRSALRVKEKQNKQAAAK